jgi:hypothetical protein
MTTTKKPDDAKPVDDQVAELAEPDPATWGGPPHPPWTKTAWPDHPMHDDPTWTPAKGKGKKK